VRARSAFGISLLLFPALFVEPGLLRLPASHRAVSSACSISTNHLVSMAFVAASTSACLCARNLLDGITRARYRESASAPKLMEARKPYLFTIDLWSTGNVFRPGHRIRLEISSSNFPRFDRNLNTGEPFGEGTKAVPARQTIFHQTDMASCLLLAVIPR
jgi:putative CocE/NonD family hydrolase